MLLLSWLQTNESSSSTRYDYNGVALFSSLLESQTLSIDTLRLILKHSRLNLFAPSLENGENILHFLSSKSSSSHISSDIIWLIWSCDEALKLKNQTNHQGRTPYQVSSSQLL